MASCLLFVDSSSSCVAFILYMYIITRPTRLSPRASRGTDCRGHVAAAADDAAAASSSIHWLHRERCSSCYNVLCHVHTAHSVPQHKTTRRFFTSYPVLTLVSVPLLGPFYGAIAVSSVTRCRCCRCGHRFYIAIHPVSLLSHDACAIAIAGL